MSIRNSFNATLKSGLNKRWLNTCTTRLQHAGEAGKIR